MSPVINLRPPGHELWSVIKPEKVMSVFVPVIIGTQFFRGFEHSAFLNSIVGGLGYGWLKLVILMVVSLALAIGFCRISGEIVFGFAKEKGIRQGDLFNYALVPLSFGFELGYQFGPLIGRLGHFFPILGRQLGIDLDYLDFTSAMGSALPWQIVFVLIGATGSWFIMKKLVKRHRPGMSGNGELKELSPIIMLALLYLVFFLTG